MLFQRISLLLSVALTAFAISPATNNGDDNTIDLKLVANWKKTPFQLNVIESFSAYNDSLYLPLVTKLLGISSVQEDEDSPVEVVLDEDYSINDKEFYDYAVSLIPSDHTHLSLINIDLANKIHSPRIQAHYEYFNTSVYDKNYCGNGEDEGTAVSAFLVQGENTYCEPTDVFALKTVTKKIPFSDIKLPFDRVIGNESNENIFVLYGDFESTDFKTFFYHLYHDAVSGKLSFVWRYLPALENVEDEVLTGYGIDLTLKRTDYIAIDDRGFTAEQQAKLNFEKNEPDTSNDFSEGNKEFWNDLKSDIQPIKQTEVSNLDIKLVDFVLNHSEDPKEQLELLKKLIQDFPKFSSDLAQYTPSQNEPSIVDTAIENVKAGIPDGLYINGAPVPQLSLDLFEIAKILKRELELLSKLEDAGIDSSYANKMIRQYASAVQKLLRDPTKVFTRYDYSAYEDGIIFFNDLESDFQYKNFGRPRMMYRDISNLGVVPQAKENIHDVIFAFSPTDIPRVYYFLTLVFSGLQSRSAQRFAFVPIIKSEVDESIAKQMAYVYQTKGPAEVLEFFKLIYQLASEGEEITVEDVLESISQEDFERKNPMQKVNRFKQAFGISEQPVVMVNGVIYSFDNSFKKAVSSQTVWDIQYLHNALIQKQIPKKTKMKDFLRQGALSARMPKLVPDSVDDLSASYIIPSSFEKQVEFFKTSQNVIIISKTDSNATENDIPQSFTFFGDYSSGRFREQVYNALKYVQGASNVKVRIVDYSDSSKFEQLKTIVEKSLAKGLFLAEQFITIPAINNANHKEKTIEFIKSTYAIANLESTTYLLLNGRIINMGEDVASADQLKVVEEYELRSRLSTIYDLLKENDLLSIGDLDEFDSFDVLSSLITNSYFFDDEEYFVGSASPRYNIGNLNPTTSIRLASTGKSLINISLVIDPINELSQKLLTFLDLFNSMDFVSVSVYMRPHAELEKIKIQRFYRGTFPSKPEFSATGQVDESLSHVVFDKVPERTLFTLDVDIPQSWIVSIKEANTDLDNVKLDISGPVEGVYELNNLLIEGYTRQKKKETVPPAGLSVELVDIEEKSTYSDTNIMQNLGYMQLKANPGVWKFAC
ncbi:unnamed protein product [Ambrosiozyma monospora]|uniref:Unnamed protein product n=1 Tax=Ambrosiozyma monospora TaxID=43982 RepID=A0ACB5SRU4_AMBMO|nr:unnamed protein product [Ambrosiozyma monospora]